MIPTLETNRLILRPILGKDADSLLNSIKVAEKTGMKFEKQGIVWGKQYHIYAI